MGRFSGKVVIVTGSSQGIGRETARSFAENGAKVTITGRDQSALEETKNLLITAGAKADDILSIIGDITEEATHTKLINGTVDKFGKIDILINNVGSAATSNATPNGPGTELENFDHIINVNLRSIIALTNLALPYLEKTKGSIVMVSSIGSFIPNSVFVHYSIAKAALDHLTRCLALDYIKKGVRVNCVNPGWISTTFLRRIGMPAEVQLQYETKNCADPNEIPIGRVGIPQDISKVILFLADNNESEYIVGQCIVVDGGKTLIVAPSTAISS